MTSPIIDFIEARLADDEAAALAVTETMDQALARIWGAALDAKAMMEDPDATEEHYLNKQRHHFEKTKKTIAVGDPARVLREVTAKRAIIAEHSCEWVERPDRVIGEADDPFCGACLGEPHPCLTVRLLAVVYSAHPGFDPNWSTT